MTPNAKESTRKKKELSLEESNRVAKAVHILQLCFMSSIDHLSLSFELPQSIVYKHCTVHTHINTTLNRLLKLEQLSRQFVETKRQNKFGERKINEKYKNYRQTNEY